MTGHTDLFVAAADDAGLAAAIADPRPAFAVSLDATRLLWVNAAAAPLLGIARPDGVAAVAFSAASAFSRRLAAHAGRLAPGDQLIDRLPLPFAGPVPVARACRVRRFALAGATGLLLTVADHPALRGDAAAAYRAFLATRPDTAPAPEAPAPAPSFRFAGDGRLVRFVFEIDADRRFVRLSPELAATVGPVAGGIDGLAWTDVAERLGLDPHRRIAAALAARQTFAGLLVDWPVDDGMHRVPVELSAFPVSRDGRPAGHRGFGVIKTGAAFRIGPAAPERPRERPATAQTGGTVVAAPMVARPLPPGTAPRLSAPEREAFDKIAEALADAFGARRPAPAPDTTPAASSLPRADIQLIDRLPVATLLLRGGVLVHASRAFLALSGDTDLAAITARGGFAGVFEGAALPRSGAPSAIRRVDGTEIAVSALLHSVALDDGPASLLVVQDAAALAAPERLRHADQRVEDLEAILDTATDGVLTLDHRGFVVGANRPAEALFGLERSAMLGLPLGELMAPDSRSAAMDYFDGFVDGGMSSLINGGLEVIGLSHGGGLTPLFMTVGRVSAAKFCAVLRDLTPWKQAERDLVAARRAAEAASSQKSDFLAKISHEVRTPLNAILGFSEVMIDERFGPIGNERYRGYMRDIHTSGSHIMSLVNDLLDLSKIEAGKLELAFEPLALNDLVRECTALIEPEAGRQRVIVRSSLASGLPRVLADSRSLRQIVLNLLSNAVKFNQPGGQVIVSTSREATGDVTLRVRDSGIGMAEADIAKALEPFRRLATGERAPGTGLGLPLTKALAEANMASLRIQSAPGEGTLVQVNFPAERLVGR